MAEVTNELIYEVLKSIQKDVSDLKLGQHEVKVELQAIRGHQLAIQQDVHNLYAALSNVQSRVERIERRLDLVDEPR